jgi:hypothetical protein
MHRIFLLGLVPVTFLLHVGCSEPLHVGDVIPTPLQPVDCNGLWARQLGDDTNGAGVTHAVDASGAIVVAGGFRGTIDLGAGPLTSAGGGDVLVAKLASDGATVWSKRFGDAMDQAAVSVATDGGGNVIVAGFARGTVDFGGGPLAAGAAGEGFLVKLDPAGNHLWSKLLGSGFAAFHGDPGTLGVSADTGGDIVLSGWINGDLGLDGTTQTLPDGSSFVARFDGDGTLVWQRSFANAEIAAKLNRKGEIALTGRFSGTFTLGGPTSPLVAADATWSNVVGRLDAQGNEVYKLQFGGGPNGASLLDGALDEGGNVVIVGVSSESSSFLLGSALVPADRQYLIKLDPQGAVVYSRLGTNRKYSYGLPRTLTTIEDGSGQSSVYVLGEFDRYDSSPLSEDTSAATNGVPDFAGCAADEGSSTFVVGLGPAGELTTCRLFAQSSYGLDVGPDRLGATTVSDGGSGRLLISGAFAGSESLDCGALKSAPLGTADLGRKWPGFVASIAR